MQLFKEYTEERMGEATETWDAWIMYSAGSAHAISTAETFSIMCCATDIRIEH